MSNAQALQCVRVRLTINLHPSRGTDALEGVRDQLSALLLRWNEGLQGVPLTFSEERIINSMAAIHSYFPFIQLEASASMLVFRPRLDMQLCGTVIRVGADYLGLHILGIFNAAIGREQIRDDLRYRPQEDKWQSRTESIHSISEGAQILFTVTGMQTDGGISSCSTCS
ncbi:hypothetical protein WJX73_002426 [Symbiochloris irregularis]|uniref:RPA43 OB domain-containing protein n=1 Tax=Symbiochloris irregularis TaxID=706552 RepID=A0AAW1PR12_9CHLO